MPEALQDNFKDFCGRQVIRLSVFREFQYLSPHGLQEYADWFYSKARGNEDAVRKTVTLVIDRAAESGKTPDIRDVVKAWSELNPKTPSRVATQDCEFCSGTGWEVLDGAEYSSARRCRCKGLPAPAEVEKLDSTPVKGTHASGFFAGVAAKVFSFGGSKHGEK